jgi:chlorobactene glucosyltransferase
MGMEIFFKLLTGYNWFVLSVLIVLFVSFLVNLKYFKSVFFYKLNAVYRQTLPLVSVLIPARNEENNIEACLHSLLVQDYRNLEIIILDDNSTDGTSDVIERIIEEHNNAKPTMNINSEENRITLKLIKGQPLQEGWVGKNYACYQLEKAASGDYLFFTDADTVHCPESVSCGLQCLVSNKLDALSVYPEMIMNSFFERMVIGFMKFGILLFLPLYLRNRVNKPLLSTALGSYMFYKRSVYKAVGGHTEIYNKCLEDMNMANLIKSKGYRFEIFDGFKTYRTRMYSNLNDIYKGFSRFILTTFNYKKALPLLLIFLVSALLLFPFVLILMYPALNYFLSLEGLTLAGLDFLLYKSVLLNLLQISLLLLIKTIYISRFEGNAIDVLLHPISIATILIMGIKLSFGGKKTSHINWKGRKYSFSNANIKV